MAAAAAAAATGAARRRTLAGFAAVALLALLAGIAAVVAQQFDVARQVLAHGLMPIIEPEVNIKSETRAACDQILLEELLKALDAMPGKQMAIDADLNAGLIGEDVARKRRAEVAQEADFYGSMDGASKFVRGDATAGIMILIITIMVIMVMVMIT